MSITELAPAKLNLTLDVGARRPDGYHEITSVMQSAALYDVVTLETVETDDIVVECPGTDLPTGPDNLAWKAADVFFQETNIPHTGIFIRLEKKIPSQAGLGGGSSDAAAVLRGMRRLFSANVSDEALETMAARVGSDVPYCVRGGTALARSFTASYVLVRYCEAPGGPLHRRDVPEAGRNRHCKPPGFRCHGQSAGNWRPGAYLPPGGERF